MWFVRFLLVCVHRNVSLGAHVSWIDNYSNLYHKNVIDSGEGTFRSCLWAVEAVIKFQGSTDVSLQIRKHRVTGVYVPALPSNLFDHTIISKLRDDFLAACTDFGDSFESRSLVSLMNVNSVPLKPTVDPAKFPDLAVYLKTRQSSMDKIYPRSVFRLNPAADVDLLKIISSIQLDLKKKVGMHYKPILCDVNLFNRALKVHLLLIPSFLYTCINNIVIHFIVTSAHVLYLHSFCTQRTWRRATYAFDSPGIWGCGTCSR